MDRYSTLAKELLRECPSLELREWEPMARHTTFRVGGPARLMVLPHTAEEAELAVKAALRLDIRPFFLGCGSNLLVADGGYEGVLIKAPDGLGKLDTTGDVLAAESGVTLYRLANYACEQGRKGLEFAQGIPGSVGGGITMNAGAYGGELSQVVQRVRILDEQGLRQTLCGRELDFSYRHSAFSDGRRMILGAEFALEPGDPAEIRMRMNELMEQRRAKQPLEYPSAGSTFKRPEGNFAAALIDQCGLKGTSIGGAQVSEKHAGFVVNRGGASCRDILQLVELVRETVLRETGVALELEIKTLGLSAG